MRVYNNMETEIIVSYLFFLELFIIRTKQFDSSIDNLTKKNYS